MHTRRQAIHLSLFGPEKYPVKTVWSVSSCFTIARGGSKSYVHETMVRSRGGAAGIDHAALRLCTHGRSGVKRWVLGSVTEKVVRHAGDPVLVIRAK